MRRHNDIHDMHADIANGRPAWSVVGALLAGLAIIGCSGSGESLSADSTCEEILTASDPAAADAAINQAAIDAGADYAGNINLTLSIRSSCGAQPDTTLRDVVDGFPKD